MQEEDLQKSRRFKPANVILFVFATLAVLGLVFSAGKYVAAPLETSVTVSDAIAESYCSSGGAVVDQSSTRLILLDANREISYIVSTDLTSDNPYFYGNVIATDSGVYVQRYLYAQSSDYIKQGQVVKYSYDGQVSQVLVQYDLDTMGERVLRPLITSMSLDGDTLYLCTCNPLYSRSSLYAVDVTSSSTVSLGDNYVIRYEHLLNDVDVAYAKYDPQTNMVYFVDQLGRAYSDTVSADYRTHFQEVDVEGDVSDFLDLDLSSSPVQATTAMGVEGDSFHFILPLFLRICSFWLAVIVAVLILVNLICKGIYASVKSRDFTLLKRAVAFVAAFAVALGIVAYYAYNMFSSDETSKTATLSTVSTTMATGYKDLFSEAATEFKANGALTPDTYNQLSGMLETQTHNAALTKNEVIYSLVTIHGQQAFTLADSSNSVISGAAVDGDTKNALAPALSGGLQDGSVITYSEENDRGSYIVAACPIFDDSGNVCAVLTAGDSLVVTNSNNLKSQVTLFITLLAAGVSISFVVLEGRKWAQRLSERRRRKREGVGGGEFHLARVMNFIAMAACGCDSAIVVLLAKDMVAGTAFDGNSLVLMLPTMFTTIGYFVGALAFAALMPRIRARKLFATSCVIAVLGYVGCAMAVANSSVILLSAGLLVANAALKILTVSFGGMTSYTSDGQTRKMLRMDNAEASITSYALVAIAASFLADNVGNEFVYVLAAVLSAVLLIVALALFPRESVFDSAEEEEGSPRKKFSFSSPETKATLHLISSPVIITLILGISFSLSLAGGFKSFLFPLLASNEGYDKSAIAQILVFCSALAFYLSPVVATIQEKLTMRKALFAGTLVIGLVFVAFVANGSLIWAIIALAVTTFLNKVVGTGQGTIWVQMIDKTKTPAALGVSAKDITGSIRSIATSPVMGLLAMLGSIWSCVVLGAYAIVGSIAFWIACRHDERSD